MNVRDMAGVLTNLSHKEAQDKCLETYNRYTYEHCIQILKSSRKSLAPALLQNSI